MTITGTSPPKHKTETRDTDYRLNRLKSNLFHRDSLSISLLLELLLKECLIIVPNYWCPTNIVDDNYRLYFESLKVK